MSPARAGGPPRAYVLSILFLLLFFPATIPAAEIHLAPFTGPITPVAAEFLVDAINDAADSGAEAIIIQLDTPGGLDDSMRRIIKAQLASPIPVVVYVGPGGSRAASAGAFITLAAHLAVMAPGTNIGSASPVQMGGAPMDSTMAGKVTHDAAAYITSLADRRGRDKDLARAMVEEALNLTAEEARDQGVIDFIAPTVPALLDSLRGRVIAMDDGDYTLPDEAAHLVTREMTGRQKFLKTLADPNLAYILMLLGIYGLFFELSNPGALVPGILGGICLLLALFAFQALPVDYTGVGLILLGVIMLIMEIKVPSYGSLSVGGLVALVLGSLMLFESTEQWARLSLNVMIPSVLVFAGFFLVCVWLVIRGQKRRVTTGLNALVGEKGRVVQAIEPGTPGKVICHGEIWNAASAEALPVDTPVVTTEVNRRLLTVRKNHISELQQRS
jgi:membrane-bound serine protease (ClpP class)